jgi:NAD(P)-dependent dehydrogenase (short-subunit alcohol dehydrogenase family)
MAVANKVPAGPASKKLSTTLPELVLITGGTSGFGFGAAEIYARRGCDVIITSRSRARAHQPLALGLADLRSVVAVVDAYKAAFGTARRLAKLILNAGVVKLVRELSPQGFEATYAANYF